jgi:hypothetical protein
MGSPKPVSASTMRGQVGHPGDLPGAGGHLGERGQADVRQSQVVGEDGAGDVDPGKPLSSISRAESGLNAPGNCWMLPEARSSRNRIRFCSGVDLRVQHLEESLRAGEVDDAGFAAV